MRVPPVAVVNQIRQNLYDRYRAGFDIIKELIQNADDAHASHFHIGWHLGLPSARHPLLRGPLLFVANTGHFSDRDDYAINSIGLSSKEDNHAIGKFGLGLKSIFHLCEAFFYLASDSGLGQEWADIVNPWADDQGHDSFHQEWDDFEGPDQLALRRMFAPVLEADRYFCLWLPLRLKEHAGSCSPILSNYPGDFQSAPALFAPRLPSHMAQLLPLLLNIQVISGWSPGGNSIQRDFRVRIDGRRLRYPDTNSSGEALNLDGKIQIEPDQLGTFQYSGQEIQLAEDLFADLRHSVWWPRYIRTDPDTGEFRQEPESAQPHAAVCFVRQPAAQKQARLSIHQAVFLPLDEPAAPFQSIPCDGSFDYSLALHGCFFVDPGRSRVDGWEQDTNITPPVDEASLRREWNGRLAQQGTMRLLLPSLERFVHTLGLSRWETGMLTQALSSSGLFQQYRSAICGQQQWVYTVSRREGVWQLLPADKSVHLLPVPPARDWGRPFEVFAGLDRVGHITFREAPCLTSKTLPSRWPDHLIVSLLQGVDVDQVFKRRSHLAYLLTCLSGAVGELPDESSDVSAALHHLARRALHLTLADLANVRSHFQKLVRFIPTENRFPLRLDIHSQAAAALFSPLNHLSLGVLLLPAELDTPDPEHGTAQLELDDAHLILDTLAKPHPEFDAESDYLNLRSQVAIQVIKATPNRDLLLHRCHSCPLFKGHDCSSGEAGTFALMELAELGRRKTLFRHGYAKPTDLGLAEHLQRSLDTAQVVVISKDVADLLPSDIPTCDSPACIQTLLTCPPVGSADQRMGLLVDILSAQSSPPTPSWRQCLRYLLHANPEAFDDEQPLIANAVSTSHDIWGKLASSALALGGSNWRLVPNTLADLLTPMQRTELGVKAITPVAVQALLQQVELTQLGLSFSSDEADTLLHELGDPTVLKQLPIHLAEDSQRVAINDSTYLAGDFELSGPLRDRITLLKPHPDPMLAAKQALLADTLDASDVIGLALRQDDPHSHWNVIMDALGSLGAPPPAGQDLRLALQATNWIPAAAGRNICPDDVLYIRDLADQVNQLTTAEATATWENAPSWRMCASTPLSRCSPGYSPEKRMPWPGWQNSWPKTTATILVPSG